MIFYYETSNDNNVVDNNRLVNGQGQEGSPSHSQLQQRQGQVQRSSSILSIPSSSRNASPTN